MQRNDSNPSVAEMQQAFFDQRSKVLIIDESLNLDFPKIKHLMIMLLRSAIYHHILRVAAGEAISKKKLYKQVVEASPLNTLLPQFKAYVGKTFYKNIKALIKNEVKNIITNQSQPYVVIQQLHLINIHKLLAAKHQVMDTATIATMILAVALNPHLSFLDLSGNFYGNSIDLWASALTHNGNIQHLSLNNCHLDLEIYQNAGMEKQYQNFWQAVGQLPLETLSLNHTRMGATSVEVMVNCLSNHLKVFNFAQNSEVSLAGQSYLINFLLSNPRLEKLDINQSHFQFNEFGSIFAGKQLNLDYLDIADSQFDDFQCDNFMQLLASNAIVSKKLVIDCKNISRDLIGSLLTELLHNKHAIEELELRNFHLALEHTEILVQLLPINENLRSLSLVNLVRIESVKITKIAEALRQNKTLLAFEPSSKLMVGNVLVALKEIKQQLDINLQLQTVISNTPEGAEKVSKLASLQQLKQQPEVVQLVQAAQAKQVPLAEIMQHGLFKAAKGPVTNPNQDNLPQHQPK